jgi:anion transporter
MSRTQLLTATLILIAALILYFVAPMEGMTRDAIRCAALGLFSIGFWATRALPEHLTSLIFMLLATASGLSPARVVFSGFYSTAFWLVFGGLVLANAVEYTGLGRSIAGRLLSLMGTSYTGVISGIVGTGMLISFIMPSSFARIMLLIPVTMALADHLKFATDSPGRTGMIVSASLACFIPSCAVLPSNVLNMVIVGASESIYGVTFSYGYYLKLHFPVIGIMKGLSIVVLTCLLFSSRNVLESSKISYEKTPFSKPERNMIVILCLTLLLWSSDFLHGISPAWVSLAASLVCLFPATKVMPSNAFHEKIDFAPLFYLAGILALGAITSETGLGEIMGKWLLRIIDFKPEHNFQNFFLLSLLFSVISLGAIGPGAPAIMTPLAAKIAAATGFSLDTVLMTGIIGYCNILFPYQVPPLVVGLQLAGVSTAKALRLTFGLAAVSIIFLIPLNYLWWVWLGLFPNH